MGREFWVCCLAIGLAGGCGETTAEVRRHTYAPSFRYLSDSQLRSAMGKLSTDVVSLDRVLRGGRAEGSDGSDVGPGPIDTADPNRVVAILTDMIRTADRLRAPALATNHPELGEGLDAFRLDLEAARAAAAARHPRYFLAGTITGACLYCHAP